MTRVSIAYVYGKTDNIHTLDHNIGKTAALHAWQSSVLKAYLNC